MTDRACGRSLLNDKLKFVVHRIRRRVETTFLPFPSQIKSLWSKAGSVARRLAAKDLAKPRSRRMTVAICIVIFLVAVGVRLFQWQDNRPILPRVFQGMVEHHKANARLLLKGDVGGFIKGPAPPGDANILTYPPGYPIVTAAVFKLAGDSDRSMRIFQIVCDAAAAVLLFFLALELLSFKASVIAGMLAALSPQLAYYSLILIPDSLVTLPILCAVYLLVRGLKQDSLLAVVGAGAAIGLSCWLRSNALLLAPFLGLLLVLMLDRARRWRYAGALVGATLLVIAPITIRNLVVFHHFIPLSLGAGQMLNVGITDYDKERRFGLPGTDIETVTSEAAASGRQDYADSLFGGNGIERDRQRTSRAIAVIRSHPIWFAGVVLQRAASMLKFERVHTVSPQPAVTHTLNIPADMKPVSTLGPTDFIARLPMDASLISVTTDAGTARTESQDLQSEALSASFAVEKNSDYLLRLPVKVEQGNVVISVTGPDQAEVYGVTPVLHALETLPGVGQQTYVVQIPFVSRDAGSAHVVIENEKRRPAPTVMEIGQMELFKLGPASLVWTRYLRAIIHFAQKFFVTAWMVPLAFIGAILLWLTLPSRHPKGGGDGGPPLQIPLAVPLALLLAVPLYYLTAQSFLHTEYRYVMAIQPSLFVLVAASLDLIANLFVRTWSRITGR